MNHAVGLIAITFGFGLSSIAFGIRQYHNYVLHRDTPAGNIQSAPMGRVKLTGTAAVATEPVGPSFADTEYVYIRWESIPRRDDNEVRLHQDASAGEESVPFYLEDESGRVLVGDPVDATVVSSSEYPLTTDRVVDVLLKAMLGVHDESEEIAAGDKITVFGQISPCGEPPGQIEDADRILERDETTDRFVIATGETFEIAGKYRRETVLFMTGGLALSTLCLGIWFGDIVPL